MRAWQDPEPAQHRIFKWRCMRCGTARHLSLKAGPSSDGRRTLACFKCGRYTEWAFLGQIPARGEVRG